MLEAGRREYLHPLARRWTIAYMDGFNHLVECAGLPEPVATAEMITNFVEGALLNHVTTPADDFLEGRFRPLLTALVAALESGLANDALKGGRRNAPQGSIRSHPTRARPRGRRSGRGRGRRRRPRGLREHDHARGRRAPPAPPARPPSSSSRSRPARAGLPLPRTDNSVTWAITDDNKPVKDGGKPEPGPLRIYNYADYLDPATLKKFQKEFSTKVEVATYNSADEAVAKLSSGAVDFDVIIGLSGSNIVDLIAHKLLAPLNHSYLPNLEKNVWPELADPFYDRGSRYTVPYVVWMDGIGWRNDKVEGGHRRHGRPLGHLLAGPGLPRQGRHPRRQARRAQHADAARRDAQRVTRPTSTPRTRTSSTRPRRPLRAS